MNNNDILKRCRYAFDLKDNVMIKIYSLVDYTITREELLCFLAKEDDYDFKECENKTLCAFLDGLIISKRGKREDGSVGGKYPRVKLNNNEILKKLRIALNYKEEDMLTIIDLAEFTFSRSELKALFRRPDHRNYKPCGDQFLRAFLRGLTIKLRGLEMAETLED